MNWPAPAQGSDGTDVNAVDVRGGKCVATGDDRGIVSLLKYPALVRPAPPTVPSHKVPRPRFAAG